MIADSFIFGTVDMFEQFGIRVITYDVLKPPLRQRKIIIPGRDGAYDFGEEVYDERVLRMECDTRIGLTRADLRELAYVLSKKKKIYLWDEPDFFYIGRIYDAAQLNNIGSIGHDFTLSFICDPFLYGATRVLSFSGRVLTRPDYTGTARTPTRIAITNTGTADAVGIQIRIRERSE